MKKLLLLIVLGVAGYFAYSRFQAGNPEHIENPVYAELRVDTKVGSRELNLVLFGAMVDDVDCRSLYRPGRLYPRPTRLTSPTALTNCRTSCLAR